LSEQPPHNPKDSDSQASSADAGAEAPPGREPPVRSTAAAPPPSTPAARSAPRVRRPSARRRRGGADQPIVEKQLYRAPPGSPSSDEQVTISTRLRRGRPLLRNAEDRNAERARRSARDLSSWSKEIYTAPPKARGNDAEPDATVTVSTRLRKPRVHLTAPTTVAQVELARFMGRWYEIARLPYFTQRRCVKNVHADYVLGSDGLVHVTNRCTHADGGIGVATGVAQVVDPNSNARLEISFRMLYGVHVFWDDYWIIGLDTDYGHALIGQPSRRRGWLLARDAHPAETDVERWLAVFAEQGFPVEELIRTPQD
jgi:apolipoprotein D and lipocalin family protein